MDCMLGIIIFFLLLTIFLVFAFGIGECYKPIKNEPFVNSSFFSHPISQNEKLDSLYSPFVLRPRENNALKYTGQCTNELYPHQTSPSGKGEMGSPNPYVEARFYAQRPILNPNQYYQIIEQMLNFMNKNYSKVPSNIDKSLFVYQDEFSQQDSYSDVMKYIMKLINDAKTKVKSMVEYAKVDTWGGENFAFTDQKVFSFSRYNQNELSEQDRAKYATNSNEPKRLVVNFNLYNTLRNISTDVNAIVFYKDNKYFFDSIDISTKKESNVLEPFSLLNKNKSNININDIHLSPTPQWIYGNTIENQTFNSKGFHDPNGKNIYIKGGIPESFKEIVNNYPQAYLTKRYNAQNLPGGPLFPETNIDKTNSKILPQFPNGSNQSWTVNV